LNDAPAGGTGGHAATPPPPAEPADAEERAAEATFIRLAWSGVDDDTRRGLLGRLLAERTQASRFADLVGGLGAEPLRTCCGP